MFGLFGSIAQSWPSPPIRVRQWSLRMPPSSPVRTGPYCVFYTHKHLPCRSKLIWDQPIATSPISIGYGVWIGHGCQLMPAVQIGDAAVIGAGSVVTKPIPDGAIAVGTPARVLVK